jgi:dTDP-4-dehydrorhamnose 3,5-epimerase-like enzyme
LTEKAILLTITPMPKDKQSSNPLINRLEQTLISADYSLDRTIEGVTITHVPNHVAEDGDFSEILRIGAKGNLELFPAFVLAQINRINHAPNAIKAWHLHYKQDEIWYVSPYNCLFVGLWDIRKNSKTQNKTMRIVLGNTHSTILFIPRGVAHGTANFSLVPVDLLSLVNQQFNKKNLTSFDYRGIA